MNLVRAELLKIFTTATWWIFTLVLIPLWAMAVLYNWGTANLSDFAGDVPPGEEGELLQAVAEPVNVAAGLYTSGQFFGVLLVLLLGAILVTNEFFHQTATTTFLTTARRERVVLAKLAAAVLLGLLFWLITTVFNLIVSPFVLAAEDLPAFLDEPAVWRAMALNALAFALWAIVGVGAGVLIRSQLGATLTLSIAYVVGSSGASLIFLVLAEYLGSWVNDFQVIVPTAASQLMISGTELPGNPPRWVGAVVLVGYAVVTGVIGTLLTKRRDIN